jgi:protein-tyrosine phosphatase
MRPPSTIHFVRVGKGRLALLHRPRRVDFPNLPNIGCTHLVTLLKESEGARQIGEMANNAGLSWVWLPVPNGKYPEGEVHELLAQALPELSKLLDEGNSLLIHCSAGIHRTGTVAYGLLRWRGMDRKKALSVIRRSRKETYEGVGAKRLRWGDDVGREINVKEVSWINSIKKSANRLLIKVFKKR